MCVILHSPLALKAVTDHTSLMQRSCIWNEFIADRPLSNCHSTSGNVYMCMQNQMFLNGTNWYNGIQSSQCPAQHYCHSGIYSQTLIASAVLLWIQRQSLGHSGTLSFSSCPSRLSSCSVRINELVEGWVMDQNRAGGSLLDPASLFNSH